MNTPGHILDFVNNFVNNVDGSAQITITGSATTDNPLIITITDASITNAKISASADIALSKLANVAAGTDGLAAGTLQATLQSLATRIAALEP
jgi:hypothetical protein